MTIKSKQYHISETLNRSSERPSVGLIVLNTDFTFERDFVRMYTDQKPNYDFYFNRIHFANPMTPESLAAMKFQLEYFPIMILTWLSLIVLLHLLLSEMRQSS
jgi:maleate isomerase